MATATYDLIASQTLGSAATSITFSSIAASWTDLRLVFVGKASIGATYISPWIQINSDTSTNYIYIFLVAMVVLHIHLIMLINLMLLLLIIAQ